MNFSIAVSLVGIAAATLVVFLLYAWPFFVVLRREEIEARAEQIWRQRSCPQGNDESIWLEAERQLRSKLRWSILTRSTDRQHVLVDSQNSGESAPASQPAKPATKSRRKREPASSY